MSTSKQKFPIFHFFKEQIQNIFPYQSEKFYPVKFTGYLLYQYLARWTRQRRNSKEI